MGRQSSEKQTHCRALGAYGVSTHSKQGGKKRVEYIQICNWSQNVDCVGLRAHESMGFVGGEGLERYTL